MAENNLGLSVIAGLDRSRSLIQINSDIKRIESQINKLNLQIKLDGNSNAEIQRQISELSRQRRNLYVDLKIRKNDLKRQYKQAVNELQNNPINVKVNTSNAQKQMTGLTNSVRNTKDETFSLANALRKALNNTGYVISSQLALQLVRNAAREATDALKEYDKYATNLSIITNGTRENSNDIIADLSEKSFEFKVDISELENAYETLLRTGKAAGELDDYLKSTVFLSKIGFEDMETSASNLATIANAFKLQSDEIENVVSSLVALDTASNTVAGKLSTAMGKTAQNAQLAGLSIDQLGAIISGLRDTTGKTEDSLATSINGILTRLYNVKLGKYEIELEDGSTEDITESLNNVERMLKTVGMDIRTSKGEFKDVTEIIDELVTKWDKLNDVQKNSIGFTFAGTHHKNTFIALVENWDRIRELTEISAESAGQAQEKYNVYLDSIEAKSAALSTAMKDMWNNLFPNTFIGDIAEATTGLVQFIDKYQLLQTALKSVAFYALAKGIVATKNGLLGMATDIKNVSFAMNLATQSTAMSNEQFKSFQMVLAGMSDKQLKLVLSNSKLTESEMIKALAVNGVTEAEARQKLATLGITQANQTATVSTFSLSGAFKALWASIAANPIGALTIAFTGLVTIYQTVQRKQEEARQEIKDTADKAKELTDNINSLYQAYSDMQTGVENGTESKENLITATNDLLKALGYEGEAVDELIKKYGTLSNAINQATADKLKNSLPDLANAVDVELEELKEQALGHDQALHWGFDLTADSPESRELIDFIKEYDKKNGGVNFEIVNSLTTRIDFKGDRDSAEGIKERLENMQALRQALFDEYGAENVQSLDIYDDLSSRITELETAYNEYNTALSNYNDTAAQAQIIQSLIGKDIPKTVDEYKTYRQELIRTAQNSGQFIGSQEDITNAIDGTISKMNEFADIRERVNNLDTAYAMFGVDDNVNSASEGIKKAFINSLSDEDLSVLIQLDKSVFDNGIEAVRQAIDNFNSDTDNALEAETNTSSLNELQQAYENISKSADSFIKNQKSVKSALEEQEKYGQLSASTIRELSQAGYSEALVTDTVTGAVTLNLQAYEKLNQQKQEKIRLDLINEKNSLEDKLKDEQTAVSDLRQEYEALAKADMEANAGRLSEITLELAKRGANIEDIRDLISQINGDITSLDAPTFDNGNTDPNKAAFDELYAKWNHDVEMNKVTQEQYINWLDDAYKQYFSDLTKYQDEYNKYEAEVYNARKDREQDLFDKKIENYKKLSDNALNKYIDGNGNELTVNASFDYARSQINSAITETQNRINELSLKTGFEDEIEKLTSDLEGLYDTLDDINKQEIESQKEYIETLKNEYSDLMDEQIDQQKKLSEEIEKSYENRISAIDKQIDALNKVSEAEERQKSILEAEKDVKEAMLELDNVKTKKRLVYSGDGSWQLKEDKSAVDEAKKNLEDKQESLEEAKQDEQIAKLEEQKELLETQKDNSKEYYDKVVEDLESQKEAREKQYDILVDIYEQLGGDKKQTSLNESLVEKLTSNGDINKAVQGLTPTEMKQAITSGVLTTDSNGNYAIDYSILDKNEQAVTENTAELEKLNNQLSGKSDAVDSNTPTYNNKNLDAEGYLIGTDGKRVLHDGKPIHAKNFSDEIAKRNTSKKMTDVVKGVGKFAGYDTMKGFLNAIMTGEYTIPTSTANSMMNSNINSRIGRDITKVPEYVNNVVNNNNAPVINQTFNVEGSMDEKTVNAVDDKINKHLIDYTDKLISQISVSSLRRQNKS
ncbi:MAG: phage tail tape measure protein [Oscillospiraceae bacterium]|nr:phage tail tape measure protein [Oscillospiraceae bacterium]